MILSALLSIFIWGCFSLLVELLATIFIRKYLRETITKDGTIYIDSNYHLMDVKKMLHNTPTLKPKNFCLRSGKEEIH